MLVQLKSKQFFHEFPPEALNSKIIFFHLDRVVVQVEAELNPLVEGNLWLSAVKKEVTLNSLVFIFEESYKLKNLNQIAAKNK